MQPTAVSCRPIFGDMVIMEMLDQWLDSTVLKVFPNLNTSTILWFSESWSLLDILPQRAKSKTSPERSSGAGHLHTYIYLHIYPFIYSWIPKSDNSNSLPGISFLPQWGSMLARLTPLYHNYLRTKGHPQCFNCVSQPSTPFHLCKFLS